MIDHSVQVDVARSANAVQANMDLEFQRNNERFAFLKWGSHAFDNMLVVPPGSGIVHQVKRFTRPKHMVVVHGSCHIHYGKSLSVCFGLHFSLSSLPSLCICLKTSTRILD